MLTRAPHDSPSGSATAGRVPRRPLRRITIAILGVLLLIATSGVAPATAAPGYARDVYFWAGYERQVDSRTCTAAATAMMLNFIARRDLKLSQLYILKWAQTRDALQNAVQRGSDPLGWSRAATYFSSRTGKPTWYKWEAYGSPRAALRRAARQIAKTGKPVGLLVAHGKHAMVMTGLTASHDPAKSENFSLYSIWVSDPYGAAHRSYDARFDARATPLNSYLQTDATPWYDAQWYGRYVVIVPQG